MNERRKRKDKKEEGREGGRRMKGREKEREHGREKGKKERKREQGRKGERKKETVKKIKTEMVKLHMLRVPSICHTYFFPALYPFWVDILIPQCWHLTVAPLTWFAMKM